MPELFQNVWVAFLFWSNDHLPIHIHVKNADGIAKFTVDPVEILSNKGIKSKDIYLAKRLLKKTKRS